MHDTEREEWLRLPNNAVLATNRPQGPPQLSPVWFLWTKGSLRVSAAADSAKVRNLQRDPSLSLCIDDPARGSYCTASGRARLHTHHSKIRVPTLELITKYLPETDPQAHWESLLAEADRVLIELAPDRWVWRSF